MATQEMATILHFRGVSVRSKLWDGMPWSQVMDIKLTFHQEGGILSRSA